MPINYHLIIQTEGNLKEKIANLNQIVKFQLFLMTTEIFNLKLIKNLNKIELK
jgi:hypothetical protein